MTTKTKTKMTTISTETIPVLAQSTLHPFKCEWASGRDVCSVVLASWQLLKQHQLAHCTSLSNHTIAGVVSLYCGLPRCNARNHKTMASLLSHVENSHLGRVFLPCPINGCQLSSFTTSRQNYLKEHFKEAHQAFEGLPILFPNETLKPLWKPHNPTLPTLPSLPQHHDIKLGCILVPPTTFTTRARQSCKATSTPMLLNSPRRKKLADKPAANPDQGTSMDYDFGPLHHLDYDVGGQLVPIIQPVPAGLGGALSRPQTMREPEPEGRELPISIHYSAFACRVDQVRNDPE